MRAQGHNRHLWLMLLCCLIPIAALGAILLFNVPVSSALLFALILLCPLAHLLLMGRSGHAHGTAQNAENVVSDAPAPPLGGLRPVDFKWVRHRPEEPMLGEHHQAEIRSLRPKSERDRAPSS